MKSSWCDSRLVLKCKPILEEIFELDSNSINRRSDALD